LICITSEHLLLFQTKSQLINSTFMNNKALLTLLGLAAWILFCNWWWCNNKEQCDCDKNNTEVIAAEPSNSSSNGVIQFNSNTFGPVTGQAWASYKDSICNLIKAGKRVEITGYYGSAEKYSGQYANLGLARADTIKDLLMAQLPGISASRFLLKSELKNDLDGATNPFIASNLMVMDTIATPSAEGGVVATSENDVTIYFPTGSANKKPSKEVDDYLVKLGARLKGSGEKALVSGHTDNKGAVAKNLELSKSRAEFVKQIVVSHGADAASVTTEGKADQEPIGDNATEAGRSQNRRVHIVISK
jgi:outer membrane protein OmpA-like peptidoglycan-associated protein